MQIGILNGIYVSENAEFRSAYPVNLIPVPKGQGISQGYLRPADGITLKGTGPGINRGGCAWNGACYRAMGDNLVRVSADGSVTTLGAFSGVNAGVVSMDYSFDRLGIASGGALYYWDGTALTKVTDPDLGTVIDLLWVDGYFMTTDGTSLVVTELADPTAVNPLKYGSAEANPDPIMALLKVRDEPYAVGRFTIEVFSNVGGSLFPFQRIPGALIQKGAIGTHACCVYQDTVAFLGGGYNEAPGIYMGLNGGTSKISTREIDTLLLGYTEAELSQVVLETRNDRANQLLYVHLPDRCLVFDGVASTAVEEMVWFVLTSAQGDFGPYLARDLIWCYDQWLVGDPASGRLGALTDVVSTHWGEVTRWEFGTTIVYNGSMGAIFHQLELVALAGRSSQDALISTAYSVDGETWSQERAVASGGIGDRSKRLVWTRQGMMRNWRVYRFRGDSRSHLSFARLEAQLEPLGV